MRLIDADYLYDEFKARQRAAIRWKESAVLAGNDESKIRADAVLTFLCEVKLTIDKAPTIDTGDAKYLEERDADAFETGYIQGLSEGGSERSAGKWVIKCEKYYDGVTCSVCGKLLPHSDEYRYITDYCPECGAKMV